jgi:acetolactate synthase I/II/III large subunit
LQLAISEPKGPVYLAAPRETAMMKLLGKIYFPTRNELGIARPVWPDPADAGRAAQWLIEARNPLICCATARRNPEAVAETVRLAKLLALPVVDCDRIDRLNFPSTHPLYGTGPEIKDADALLMLEALVAYTTADTARKPGSKVIWADADPVMSAYETMDFQADLWLPVTAATAAGAICEAATALLSKSDMSRIAERRELLEASAK